MKITLLIDQIYDNETETPTTDPKKAAKIIKDTISHLGNFEVFYKPTKIQYSTFLKRVILKTRNENKRL